MRVERQITRRQRKLLEIIEQACRRYPGANVLVAARAGGKDQYRRVVEDAVLPPSSKVLWLVMAAQAQQVRPFPAMPDLQRLANIRSPSAFTGSLEILRVNRWLTVSQAEDSATVRVSMLHSPPLALQDVLVVDREYVAYLEDLREQGQRYIRTPVDDALREIQMGRRDVGGAANGRWAFARPIRASQRDAGGQMELAFSGLGLRDRQSGNESENLIFPVRWTPEQVRLAHRYVSTVPSGLRQAVIDELEGRVGAVARGAAPVYNELRFLKRLCKAARAGTFHPNLGGPVRREREKEVQRRVAQRPRAIGRKEDSRNSAAAARAFEQIWASLNENSSDSTG